MALKTAFIAIIFAPLSLWGFSSESISHYQKTAEQKNLASSSEWLRLGHYRKSLLGNFESPFRGKLFISPEGINNPEAELKASIELLLSKPAEQCRYPARTAWLKKVLELPAEAFAPCPELDAWKKQLGAQEIYIIFASADLNSLGSSFGHTFLRAHNPKNIQNLDLLDYGINYAASTGEDDGALFALKGLFGFYPGSYSMLPYHQKMREYTNLEGRDLWEYKLNLTPEQVDAIIDHLLELDNSYAEYFFLKDNCSRQILELIEVARPDLDLSSQFRDSTIPLDTLKVLEENHLLAKERLRLSLQTEWRESYRHLNRSQKNAMKTLTELQDIKALDGFSTREQAEILDASLRYLSIQDYRHHRDSKEAKYGLSVTRARLGVQTDSSNIEKVSPLASPDSRGLYFGYGKLDENEFYRFKYRRAFHDLLSQDSGSIPFSHLEVLSAEFRYFSKAPSLDLSQFVLVKMLSTSPINELDTPISWQVDVGTLPKLSPYFNLGFGYSYDFNFFDGTRSTLMAVSENYQLADTAEPYLGAELLLMSKGSKWRSVLDGRYLLKTTTGEMIWDYGAGFSVDIQKTELRLEARNRENIPEVQVMIVF